jgi:predicted ArsR family transcriptional regulator
MTKNAIRRHLDALIEQGVIRSYQLQSDMPGLRWTLEGYGSFSTRGYTTSQVQDFLTGVWAAQDAARRTA